MILSPLQNIEKLGFQKRPVITQSFGENPSAYKKFGFKGHEGTDLRAAIGTKVFAPIDGTVEVKNHGEEGYGLHVIISNQRLRVLLAHLSKVDVHTDQVIGMGEAIGETGDTGNSNAPHLHISVIKMNGPTVKDPKNGYGGAFNAEPYMINWFGTFGYPIL